MCSLDERRSPDHTVAQTLSHRWAGFESGRSVWSLLWKKLHCGVFFLQVIPLSHVSNIPSVIRTHVHV